MAIYMGFNEYQQLCLIQSINNFILNFTISILWARPLPAKNSIRIESSNNQFDGRALRGNLTTLLNGPTQSQQVLLILTTKKFPQAKRLVKSPPMLSPRHSWQHPFWPSHQTYLSLV